MHYLSSIFDCLDPAVCVDCSKVVIVVLLDNEVCPGHEKRPHGSRAKATSDVRNRPVFRKRKYFRSSNNAMELHEHLDVAVIVVAAWVAVIAQDIHPILTGVPVRLGSAPNPNQVVNGVVGVDPLENNLKQLFAGSRSLGTPPEPFPTSLMQWPPENRNLSRLQPLELNSNGINIPDSCVVFCSICNYSLSHVEVCVVGVESARSQLTAHG